MAKNDLLLVLVLVVMVWSSCGRRGNFFSLTHSSKDKKRGRRYFVPW